MIWIIFGSILVDDRRSQLRPLQARFVPLNDNPSVGATATPGPDWDQARRNADVAREAFERVHRSMEFWLDRRIPPSGLIPDDLDPNRHAWSPKNAAADNYPFHVLTARFTDPEAYRGPMVEILRSETIRTSRSIAGEPPILPDTWNLESDTFNHAGIDRARIAFGASEYAKDGLLPILELLGANTPWYARMIAIIHALWEHNAHGLSAQGRPIPLAAADIRAPQNLEMHGEQLQVLSRLYAATSESRYLDWALRIGDHYLMSEYHPTKDFDVISLRDHSNEIIGGLAELFALLSFEKHPKAELYRAPIHAMLDTLLTSARQRDGLFREMFAPSEGVFGGVTADNVGYIYNAFYIVYLADRTNPHHWIRSKVENYRYQVIRALENLDQEKYYSFSWEGESADGFADVIEGVLGIYNFERLTRVEKWLDSEISVMWAMQGDQPSSMYWHGEGNFHRTSLMYAFWKTKGVFIENWRSDLSFGAVYTPDGAGIAIIVNGGEEPWRGRLRFDEARHFKNLRLPINYPRINAFPEWFVIDPARYYVIKTEEGQPTQLSGADLLHGWELNLSVGETYRLVVTPAD